MADWLSLACVAVRAQPGRGVATAPHALDHAAFLLQVADWRRAFAAQPGPDWVLYFDDAVRFAAALFGAWHAGKRVFLCGDNLPQTLNRLQAQVDGFAGDMPDGWPSLQPLAGGEGEGNIAEGMAPLDEQATRLVVFTSGSTGEPVAIEKRLCQLAREVEALEAAFGANLGDAQVHGTVSHQHIYGLLFRVLWPLASGRRIAARAFFPEDLVAALAGPPSVLVASPAHLRRLPGQLDWTAVLGKVRAVFSSGGPLPAEAALRACALLGEAPTEIYGSSETGGIAWRRWHGEQPAWQPLPGVQWRIDEQQLEVRSPHLPQSGWWRSEDRVEADAQGFRLLGRADRIVKIEERRVSLDALERQLSSHPDVREARVLLLPGSRNMLAAVVVPVAAETAQLSAGERRAYSQRLGHHLAHGHDAVTRPRRWRFVEALPVNAQGKTTESALLALFRPQAPEPHWLLRGPAHAELELELDVGLAVFDGHFPGTPILPGVAQLDWAVRFAREVFAMPPRFVRMEALKFQRVARPGDRLQLSLEWQPHKQALVFAYRSLHGPHASGRVVFDG